ncbi:MAG TPA: GGDEF domain-containing protein [Actinophytocola sp.]|uniref:GGDEF domain-containing protein n=1 Tax=Actinophytocola sp. TaxID=1872138 RepID=UPI002DBC73A2|nr:GGDEF domain-containing protein [Actinophytocola sp.]HEU5475037.1 GGDEF domain-containing protein [Actinophytocola sp.]
MAVSSLAVASRYQVVSGRVRLVNPGSWSLWAQPRRVIGYVLIVEIVTVAATIVTLLLAPMLAGDLATGAVLLVLCIGYGEASRTVERAHRQYLSSPFMDLNSVWIFAAALLLHPALAAALITAIHLHRWVRVAHRSVHRVTFSAAAAIAAVLASSGFLALLGSYHAFAEGPRDLAAFAEAAAAAAVFLLVNNVLVSGVIALSIANPSLRAVTADWSDYGLEAATLALGVLLAWSLSDWPPMALAIVGVTLVLHGRVLIRQLREAARTDPKTGLLNTAAWYDAARREIERAARQHTSVGVLMIDLDHFKQVNDDHGHLTGDEVLVAVAKAIAGQVRGYDLVGRFGGDEFVVLLPAIEGPDLVQVAERIRRTIAGLAVDTTGRNGVVPFGGQTASIGLALFPRHGGILDQLLHAADGALLAAKSAGRDRVRLADPPLRD